MVKRNQWPVVGATIFALLCISVGGLAGYWRYANQLPVYPTPSVVMPVPNAYDDYVAAAQMSAAVGGATVGAPAGRSHRGGPPSPFTPGTSRQREASEPDVPLEQVRAVVARNRTALARLR